MKLLFICNQGENRSKLAETIFSEYHETKSAGLHNNILKKEQLEWADIVIVMEDRIITEISKMFPKEYMRKRIINLDIPDIYNIKVKRSRKELGDILIEKINGVLNEIK